MIFTVSLSPVARKAMPGKCVQKSIGFIMNAVTISPADGVSEMEVLLLGPADFRGAAAKQLPAALAKKHPDICAIYLCSNDKERGLCNVPGVNVKVVKPIDAKAIRDAVSEFYGQQLRDSHPTYGTGADKVVSGDSNPTPPKVEVKEEPEPEPAPVDEPETPAPEAIEPEPEPVNPEPAQKLPPTPKEMVESVRTFQDWDILCKNLERDAIIQDALLRSSEFSGVKQMMEVYSVKMNDVMRDPLLTQEQKLAELASFGRERTNLAAAANASMVDKWLTMWNTVCTTAQRVVKSRLDEINSAVVKTQVMKDEFLQKQLEGGQPIQKQLTSYAVELVAIKSQLMDLWAFVNKEAYQEIAPKLNEKLPSESEFINSYFGESAKDFYAPNTEELIDRIMTGISESRIPMSQVQDKVSALFTTVLEMLKASGQYIDHQQDIITMLRANHVENIVVRDTLLKDCFRVFVGCEGTGLSATVAVYASMIARRGNTLVVDFTGHSHYDRYSQQPIELSRFMEERVQQPLLFVTTKEHQDPEQISLLMNELKNRMVYYRHLIVVLDAEQREELDQLGREALTISYVTDCSADSISKVSQAYQESRSIPNVGRMLVSIDAPVDATILIKTMGMDMTNTRLVLLPYLNDIKKMAIVNGDPAEYGDVMRIFESAFRV